MTLAREALTLAEPDTRCARTVSSVAPPRRSLPRAAAEAPDALLLGSILPDLPYHARFAAQLVRHLSGREYLLSEWGDVFHTRGTGQLALALLAHVKRSHLDPPEEARVLALAAGYLSHHAVDRVVHPVINQLVKRVRDSGETDEPGLRTHERLERWQSLFYHQDLLGEQIAGGAYGRRVVRSMAGSGLVRPRLDPLLGRALRAACLEVHGRAPVEADVSDWLWGTTAYSVLFSSPLGRIERPREDPAQLRRRFYLGPDVNLVSPLRTAQQTTLHAWEAAEQLLSADSLTAEVRSVFLRRVPDVDLGTGS
jgi:hypothetical protein